MKHGYQLVNAGLDIQVSRDRSQQYEVAHARADGQDRGRWT